MAASTRWDAGGVGAVGEQDDDLGRVRPWLRRRAGRSRPAAWTRPHGRHVRVDLGDGVHRLEDRRADRRAATRGQRVDGVEQLLPLRGRRHRELREARRTRPARSGCPASWARTKSRTAACAAESRLGSTSVAHIEPDTSSARITAAPDTGTSVLICGRAAARARQASDTQHQRERHVPPPRRAGRGRRPDQRDARVRHRPPAPAPEQPQVADHEQRQGEQRRAGRTARRRPSLHHPPEPREATDRHPDAAAAAQRPRRTAR